MDYLLDTNILITYGRSAKIANRIEKDLALFDGKQNLAISVVSLGELDSLFKQFKYGEKRISEINKLLSGVYTIDINIKEIIAKYGELDAFSQGKLDNVVSNFTARNMEKTIYG